MAEQGRPEAIVRLKVPNGGVSVVIANRNGEEHLRICLPSLRAQLYQPIEIIVVDNSSSDNSMAVAREFGAECLQLKENMGLAPALNRGAAISNGQFLLFVNNDMRFDECFVSRLVDRLARDEAIFAVDGMQYNWDGSVRGHLAARLEKGGARRGVSVELVPGLNFYQEQEEGIVPVFMASAASMLIRKSYFEKLRGFDDKVPMGYEDADICWRAWVHGWKTVYVPDAICWHRVGSSCRSSEGSLFLFVGVLRGRLVFATKLLPIRYALLTWITSMAGLAKDISRLQWRFAWSRIRVLADLGARIPQLLRERNELYRSGGTTPAKQLDRMLQLTSEDPEEIVEAPCHGLAAKSPQ
jgi:GT2 family glycosyltransferase